MKVMFADDDPTTRKILETLLVGFGYEPVLCRDGLEALECFKRPDAPQIAILDWNMPKLDGLALCRKIREHKTPRFVYIILLTARDSKQELVQGLEAGADDYIIKPLDKNVLRARLRVAKRIIELQQNLLAVERLETLTRTAGAAAHEINNPLMSLLILSELCLAEAPNGSVLERDLLEMQSSIQRICDVVQSMQNIKAHKTKTYSSYAEIIDFRSAAKERS